MTVPVPHPCAYCSLEHGNALFPPLVDALAREGIDSYDVYPIIRRFLCTSVAYGGVTCDPAVCRRNLEPAIALGVPMIAAACKETWRDFHDRRADDHDDGAIAGMLARLNF